MSAHEQPEAPGAPPGTPPGALWPPGALQGAEVVEPATVRFGEDGLVVAVVQDAQRRDVLMVGYMDPEALQRTLRSGRTWFWSRSRQEHWCKGETSGNRQHVRRVSVDCDGDALLVEVHQEGVGACHTGERTCFYRRLEAAILEAAIGDEARAGAEPAAQGGR